MDSRPTTDRPPTDHRPTTDRPRLGDQLTLDFDRPFEVEASVRAHAAAAGLSEIEVGLLILALPKACQTRRDGRRVGVVRSSQRETARRLGRSKSGVQEAVRRLAARRILAAAAGCYAIDWEAVAALEPLPEMVPVAFAEGDEVLQDCTLSARGRSVVGPCQDKDQRSLTPTNQSDNPMAMAGTDRPPTDRAADDHRAASLGMRLTIAHLRTGDGGLNRSGLVRVYAQLVSRGWMEDDGGLEAFGRLVGLAAWILDERRPWRGYDIRNPVRWMVWALRAGTDEWAWRIGDEHLERARRATQRDPEGVRRDLERAMEQVMGLAEAGR